MPGLKREARLRGNDPGIHVLLPVHPSVLLLAFYNFFALMAEWGVNLWFPTVLKETGLSIGAVGLFAALPSGLGILLMVVVAASSDRYRERKWHMIAMTAAAGLPLLIMQATNSPLATMICLSIAVGVFLGRFGPFWTLPGEILPPAVAGVGIGLINGAGNLGGTVGPYFFGVVKTDTGSFSLALAAAGVSLILSALIAMPIATRRPSPR